MTDKYMILVEGQAGRHYDIVELEWHSDCLLYTSL